MSEPLNVTDAESYLSAVRARYASTSGVYNQFLDILKDFRKQSIDILSIIYRVSRLFNGHPHLIEGFNTFLLVSYNITISADPSDPNTILVATPEGKVRSNTQIDRAIQDTTWSLPVVSTGEPQSLKQNKRHREEESRPGLPPGLKPLAFSTAKRAKVHHDLTDMGELNSSRPDHQFPTPTKRAHVAVGAGREGLFFTQLNGSQQTQVEFTQGRQEKVLVDVLLDQLASILKAPEKRKALQQLRGNHAQILIDFLYWVLLQQRTPSQVPWLRKHILIVLCKLSGSSMLYPRWYVLRDIVYQSREDSGGFCDIHKGRFDNLELCLKVIRVPQRSQLDKMLKIYAKEAILWGQLHHPNITPFYGIFYLDDTQKTICLVSPWMNNGNIVTYLERNATVPRKPFIRDIANGLKYLHDENIIHADLKGMNILVNDFGRACITDFGISIIWTDRTLGFTHTTGGVVARSTRWAAPELLGEGENPSRASDVWAFGCVCYEVLTRKLPFHECTMDFQIIRRLIEGKPPAQSSGNIESDVLDGVDNNTWEVMNWCWSTKPKERPTCDQILQRLELQGLVNTEPEGEARARFLRESRYLQVLLGKNSDINIDLVRVEEILAEILLQPQSNPQVPWLWKQTLTIFRNLSRPAVLSPRCYVLRNIVYEPCVDNGELYDTYKGRFDTLELWLKVIRPQQSRLKRILMIQAKEMLRMRRLNHSNLIPFYGIFYFDETKESICLVSPWMNNGSIVAYLQRNPAVPRKPLIRDVANGLRYLHSSYIIHGDLKGVGILVNDFGMACIAAPGMVINRIHRRWFTSATEDKIGRSVRWASPELTDGEPSEASDVWAFGCICYEIFSRKLPFQECETDTQIVWKLMKGELPARRDEVLDSDALDAVDDNMWELMNSCWSLEPEERPTCDQILQRPELEGLMDTEPEGEASARFLHERRFLEVVHGKNSDTNIDMAKVGEILAGL